MARHVTGPGSRWQDLLLIYFQRQVVRIAKEGKAFTGKGIDTNRFALHAMRGEMGYRGVDVIHANGNENNSITYSPLSARSPFQESRSAR